MADLHILPVHYPRIDTASVLGINQPTHAKAHTDNLLLWNATLRKQFLNTMREEVYRPRVIVAQRDVPLLGVDEVAVQIENNCGQRRRLRNKSNGEATFGINFQQSCSASARRFCVLFFQDQMTFDEVVRNFYHRYLAEPGQRS